MLSLVVMFERMSLFWCTAKSKSVMKNMPENARTNILRNSSTDSTVTPLKLIGDRQHVTRNTNKACTQVSVRKSPKNLVFLLPMQVPTHGQWWS